MGATTVTGKILGVDNAAQVGVYVTFRLKSVGTDSVATSTVDQDAISVITDASGDFSTTLWDNGDSGVESVLEILMPSGQRIDVVIPAADAAIDIWDLIENYQVGVAAPQLPANQALFMRKADNLSDVASASTSRTNLDVYSTSEADTEFVNKTSEQVVSGTKHFSFIDIGTALAVTSGGTGASTASAARTNLGAQEQSTVLDNTTASYTTAEETKLSGIEALADVTDTANVTAAGALMDSEVDADIKTLALPASTTISTFGASLIDDATAADARTTLGVDAAISDANAAGNQGKQVIRSVTFPTTSDFLSVADHASLDVGTGDFSLFFTARIDSDSATESIIYKYGGGIGYQVQFVSGALQLIMNDGVEDVFSLATGMNDDKWHVYVITVDRDGNATAYIDNVAQTPVDVTSAALTLDNAGQVQIGVNGSSNPLDNGALASYVGLTKDLITAAEIEDASFDTTRLKDLSNLSLCVDMASLQVDVFTDRSSNAHTVTVNGSLTYNDDRGDLTVPNATIVVRSASDLSGTLVSDKVYLIDGAIDMGTQTITVPSGGLELNGFGVNVSKLTSTENSYTMFVDSASDAGNLFISNLDIDVSGTSSQVFDLDNSGASGAVEMNVVNFTNCTSLGTLDAYRQFLMVNSFWLSCSDGLTFAGTWSGGARIETFLVRAFGSSGTVFTGSTSPALTFASRFLCNGNIDIPSGSTVYDFAASMFTNDADFELILGEYTGAGTIIAVKSPVIDNTSTKSRHRDNNGLEDTYIGGRWRLSSTTATSIGDTNFYKVAGTTVASDLQWFSAGTANDLTYDSTEVSNVEIKGTISVTSAGNGQDITFKLRQYDDSATAYVDLDTMPFVTTDTGSGRAQNVAILGYAVLDENDRIELWVSNASSANATVQLNSILSVTGRAK